MPQVSLNSWSFNSWSFNSRTLNIFESSYNPINFTSKIGKIKSLQFFRDCKYLVGFQVIFFDGESEVFGLETDEKVDLAIPESLHTIRVLPEEDGESIHTLEL